MALAAAIHLFAAMDPCQLPEPNGVPEHLPNAMREVLIQQRSDLGARSSQLLVAISRHNALCSRVESDSPAAASCAHERSKLTAEIKTYSDDVAQFNRKAVVPDFNGAALVTAMELADRALAVPKDALTDESIRCSAFFIEIGKQMRMAGHSTVGPEWQPGTSANRIIAFIRDDSAHWQKFDESRVQDLANRGALVVGVSPDTRAGHHGHIAIVFPVTELTNTAGRGPFVRDGNVHASSSQRKIFPSSWGAVRASEVFRYSSFPPDWYLWVPSRSH